MIELLVCDMAGTTVRDDNEVRTCFMAAAAKTGLKADPVRVNGMMGWPKRRVFEALWADQLGGDHPEYADRTARSFQEFKIILENHYRTQPVVPTEGCLELFAWLKSQNIKIALTTGFYREVTDIILERLGWQAGLDHNYLGSGPTAVINCSVTPSEIYNEEGRPAPFMIQKAMYRLGISDPQRVVNIGDTPSDLAAGFSAHCRASVAVTNGTHTAAELVKCRHDRLLGSLHELPEYLASLEST